MIRISDHLFLSFNVFFFDVVLVSDIFQGVTFFSGRFLGGLSLCDFSLCDFALKVVSDFEGDLETGLFSALAGFFSGRS
ncbi:MAG TPA: hypothetical protein DCP14_01800, partial [Rhodobiaceae bacterium]|nr:hypothetical protein [Rhodobiaceae bacterium]